MKPKVLIVDDSRSARFFLRSTLPQDDIEITEASNGQEAVERHREWNPDVTILDLTMPVMDGFEALERIREHNPGALVIILTADIQQKTVDRITELGAYGFIKKPPRTDSVWPIVQEALSKAGAP